MEKIPLGVVYEVLILHALGNPNNQLCFVGSHRCTSIFPWLNNVYTG